MKHTLKLRRAIFEAIYDATDDVQEATIHDIGNRPPEDWTPEETHDFDLIHRVANLIQDKIKETLDTP